MRSLVVIISIALAFVASVAADDEQLSDTTIVLFSSEECDMAVQYTVYQSWDGCEGAVIADAEICVNPLCHHVHQQYNWIVKFAVVNGIVRMCGYSDYTQCGNDVDFSFGYCHDVVKDECHDSDMAAGFNEIVSWDGGIGPEPVSDERSQSSDWSLAPRMSVSATAAFLTLFAFLVY